MLTFKDQKKYQYFGVSKKGGLFTFHASNRGKDYLYYLQQEAGRSDIDIVGPLTEPMTRNEAVAFLLKKVDRFKNNPEIKAFLSGVDPGQDIPSGPFPPLSLGMRRQRRRGGDKATAAVSGSTTAKSPDQGKDTPQKRAAGRAKGGGKGKGESQGATMVAAE